jgi:phage terminase large subunit-like protein
MWIETFGAGSAPFKLLQQAAYPVRELTVDAGTRVDKIARAGHGVALYERHGIFHPAHAEWLPAAEKELTTFPNAAHDDIVDTVSYAARLLPQIARLAGSMRQQTVKRPVTAGLMAQQF